MSDWSLGETEALAVKAIRGSGMAWGIAEEGGMALRWLCAHALPGIGALTAWLQQRDRGRGGCTPAMNFSDRQDPLCPIALGCWIKDASITARNNTILELGVVCQPLLLLPFLTKALCDRGFTLEFNGQQIGSNIGIVRAQPPYINLVVDHAQCCIALTSPRLPEQMKVSRVPLASTDDLKVLQTFAQRIYAPATTHSRRAGAGERIDD